MVNNVEDLRNPMNLSSEAQIDQEIDQAIERWNLEKHYRVFPTSVRYAVITNEVTLTFENGSKYQFNPLHIQEVTLETLNPTAEQLGDIVIRAGGASLHWPQLDASIGIDNLLLGRYGTDQWMLQLKAVA
jgi:hypothetical protein